MSGNRPVRAIQRVRAVSANDADAALLQVAPGSPSLHVLRTAYLSSGRGLEFTRSIYRGDTYDFVAELRLGELFPAGSTADGAESAAVETGRRTAQGPLGGEALGLDLESAAVVGAP